MTGESRVIALVGAPNCGKTTIFNSLTGQHQTVGNYPGVTVEKKTGRLRSLHGAEIQVVDLPGAYSLIPRSPDEQVTRDVLMSMMPGECAPDLILCVLDAVGMERQLPFVLQVLELEIPVVLILNRIDLADKAGLVFDQARLSESLGGIPVVFAQANAGKGLVDVKRVVGERDIPAPGRLWKGAEELESALAVPVKINDTESREAVTILSDPDYFEEETTLPQESREELKARVRSYLRATSRSLDEDISLERIAAANRICEYAIVSQGNREDHPLTARLDGLFLHRIWGWVFFVLFFFGMFWAVFSGGKLPSAGIEWLGGTLSLWVDRALGAGPLRDLLVDGVIAGAFGVLGFLPQILILFFILGILESSGYMARAAYLLDGVMRKAGLPGKAFIPLLSGYACALPGIMAARIIPNAKDRLLTILVLPWISCSARLPVYILMISLLFGAAGIATVYQGAALLALYALGTVAALVTARLLRRTITKRPPALLLLELPHYQLPDFRYIGRMLWSRGTLFLKRVGTVVAVFTVILWAASTYPRSEHSSPADRAENSYLGMVGKTLEPAFKPLGFDWRITTGILSSFVAREMFNSHMSVVFASEGSPDDPENFSELQAKLAAATWPSGRPLFTPAVCVSILVYYVFALQCFASIMTMRRETGSLKWTLIQFLGMAVVAYFAACVAYAVASRIWT